MEKAHALSIGVSQFAPFSRSAMQQHADSFENINLSFCLVTSQLLEKKTSLISVQLDAVTWTLTEKSPQFVPLQLLHEHDTVFPAGFVCDLNRRRSQYRDEGEDALEWPGLRHVATSSLAEMLLGDSSAIFSNTAVCSTVNVRVCTNSISVSCG
jgi:hypothetical protein